MKKKIVLLALTFILAFVLVFATACHEHEFGEWQITAEPTETTAGTAKRTCTCGETEEVALPALSDTDVWSKTENPATHEQDGSIVYTSEYGTVTIVLPKGQHSFTWTISEEPTLEAEGTLLGRCECGELAEQSVAALSDTSVWTVKSTTPSTCTTAGETVYTSVYGDVTVTLALAEHNYGGWTITTEPTTETVGSATRTCQNDGCTHQDVAEVPVLTDSVWSVTSTPADYENARKDTYTSVYGTVVVTVGDRLHAPYENKTYYTVDIDTEDVAYGTLRIGTSWHNANATIDENGVSYHTAYPFSTNDKAVYTLVDPATGEIKVDYYKKVETENPDDEWGWGDYEGGYYSLQTLAEGDEYETTAYETETLWMDMATGIFVMPRSGYTSFHVAVPSDAPLDADNFGASKWGNSVIVTYDDGEISCTIFIHEGTLYMGASAVTTPADVSAADMYTCTQVTVKDNGGAEIATFVENAEGNLVLTDGLHGTYTGELGDLVISGSGIATLGDKAGTYVKAVGADYTLDVYVDGSYYQVTLADGAYTAVKPMATITFDLGGVVPEQQVPQSVEVNVNVAYALPADLTNATKIFAGWYYDAEYMRPVEEQFVPTQSVTLHALWTNKIHIVLNGVLEGDPTDIYVGEGYTFGDVLPTYTVDGNRYFKGWYLESTYETVVAAEAVITASDDGKTLYALWTEIPAYVGEYHGSEMWGKSSGNSSHQSISIDEQGNITSSLSRNNLDGAVVTRYEPDEQKVYYKQPDGTTEYFFFFDAETGLLVTGYYGYEEIGYDFYLFSKAATEDNFKASVNYGIDAPKTPGGTVTGYYLRIVTLNTLLGERTIVMYDNRIYNDVTLKDTLGNVLGDLDAIKNSRTIVVINNDTNETVIALAGADGGTLDDGDTVALDAYYGTYTGAEGDIVLDGTGSFVWGDKTGTYNYVGTDYTFELFVVAEGANAEYYRMTAEGYTYTVTKPMVTISFTVVGPEGATDTIAQIEVNAKIAATLPDGNGYNTDYVFNGYFTNSECTAAIATPYITAESVTLYAKYSNPAVLTIVFKDGVTSNATVRYSVGDVATVEIPVYAGYAFVGWYTTEDYQQGTEWTSGSVITTDTTIYAKWETAPIFNHHHYGLFYLGDREDDNDNPYGNNGADHRQGEFTFDPYGAYQVISSSGPWPFNNNPAQINDFDPEAGTMTITYGYSGGDTGEAYIDMETGFIVLNYMDVGADLDRMFLLVPGFTANAEYSNFADSFWNAGKTRTIAFTITEEDGTQKNYSLFIHENQVYFNVSFKTAETGGMDISADACYNSTLLYVLADDGSLIAKFAYDGNTMVEMDGSEGTYTNADGEGTIVLNGAGYVTIGENTYVITKVDGAEGPDGTYGVYTDTEYLEYTIDVEAKTYTVTKPMVHVTYNAGSYATVPAADVNKNFGIVLPVPECDTHIFRYWCTDADLNNPVELVDGKYIPTGDVTLFAKWDVRVNLTLDLGDGVTQVHGYGAGDALDISQYDPAHTNEKIFGGWYKDSTFSEEFTDVTITDNITVYAKWIDAGTCTVTGDSTYAFVYDAESGWWKNNNQEQDDTSASVVIEAVDGPIIVKVTYWISSEANWDYLSSSVYGTVEGDPINTKGSNYTEEEAQTAEFLLQAGSTLTLTYSKDSSGADGDDTAYLQIVVNGTAVTDYVPAA